jgi:hypothetical protein
VLVDVAALVRGALLLLVVGLLVRGFLDPPTRLSWLMFTGVALCRFELSATTRAGAKVEVEPWRHILTWDVNMSIAALADFLDYLRQVQHLSVNGSVIYVDRTGSHLLKVVDGDLDLVVPE